MEELIKEYCSRCDRTWAIKVYDERAMEKSTQKLAHIFLEHTCQTVSLTN